MMVVNCLIVESGEARVAGGKRSLSHASEISRARKAAKTNSKVVMTQLQNSKTARRKMPPIVSRSPILNAIARKKAQSYARSPNLHGRSPNSHGRSPNQAGTLKSPSLHDLSPVPAHGTPTTSHDPSPAATIGSKRTPRKLTSIIWNDAEPIYIDGYLMQGLCKYCNIVLPASKVSGTSQLARHMKVCEVKSAMDGVIQQIKTSDEIDPDWKFDQEASRVELVKLIVLHGLPFSFVEYAGFRKFCAALNPWFKSVNRVTIQNDCMDSYYSYRNSLESFFMNCNHRVSLTGDMWTSNQKLGYLCITCHWIDDKWRIRHRIIRFCLVETPQDAWNMLDVVLKSLSDWNIEDKIFSFTMDNAEVNTKMIGLLRKNLVDRVLIHHEGRLLHVRCLAHVLNLVVQDGLKAMNPVVDNIRESVKYIRSSQARKEQFAKIVTQLGIKCKHQPTPDVSSRWNSAFLMLDSTLPFRKVFETLQKQEPTSYTFGPSTDEWKMVEDICQLLKVFYHATNVISGSNYPTSNLYFLEIWSVKVILDEQEKSKNGTIRSMVNEMKKKFQKYFMESYLTNCIPVILDPRFKMEHVEFRLKQYFGVDAHKHIQKVKIAMKTLFIEYAAEIEDNVDFLSQEPNGEKVVADTVLSDWDEHVKVKKVGSRNELQRYLDEDFHPRTIDFDILNWWGVNSARYPTLGRIARDVLAVPASTVASESAFSFCGRVITDHRSSLAPETVEALMCFGYWIKPGGSFEASTSYVVS
uniref:Uncharacterized protein n=1 Tax=Avena sativa TaxID=4498 RepID=A0ACD5WLU8_AVESA